MSKIIDALKKRDKNSIALIESARSLTCGELLSGAIDVGGRIKNCGVIGVMIKNSAEWVALDIASILESVTLVPIAEFLSSEQIAHIIVDAQINFVITDDLEKFRESKAEEFLILGKKFYKIFFSDLQSQFLRQNNIAKITYTSGTTGNPKGVCLTQEAIEIVATSLLNSLGKNLSQKHLCLLPFSVLLENVAGLYVAMLAEIPIFIWNISYDAKSIIGVISESKAQSCILVPELLKMFLALPCDFSQFTYMAVGGATVSEELLIAAKAHRLPVYQGYGLSESSSVVAINTPQNNKIGSVGKVLPHIDLSIAADGEIILHNILFSGYLKQQQDSSQAFATGDIGHLDDDGYLYISGRKKNIFINSFGRNISPEWVESKILAKSEILQAVVFGEAMPFLTAVIVTKNPALANVQIEELNKTLPEYAAIKSHIFAVEPFSVKNKQLTGSGKLRREAIFKQYQNQITL